MTWAEPATAVAILIGDSHAGWRSPELVDRRDPLRPSPTKGTSQKVACDNHSRVEQHGGVVVQANPKVD